MVIDIGEGERWNRARRTFPKRRALGVPSKLGMSKIGGLEVREFPASWANDND